MEQGLELLGAERDCLSVATSAREFALSNGEVGSRDGPADGEGVRAWGCRIWNGPWDSTIG